MTYHFIHYFNHEYPPLGYREPVYMMTDEKKIEIAMRKATDDLAKELMKYAHFRVEEDGNVRGTIDIP